MAINSAEEIRKTKIAEAYAWAIGEKEKLGLLAQPIRLDFDDRNDLIYDKECHVSLFRDETASSTIIRQDWGKDTIKYNIIVNYYEISRIAPASLRKLIDNGIALYEHYAN